MRCNKSSRLAPPTSFEPAKTSSSGLPEAKVVWIAARLLAPTNCFANQTGAHCVHDPAHLMHPPNNPALALSNYLPSKLPQGSPLRKTWLQVCGCWPQTGLQIRLPQTSNVPFFPKASLMLGFCVRFSLKVPGSDASCDNGDKKGFPFGCAADRACDAGWGGWLGGRRCGADWARGRS